MAYVVSTSGIHPFFLILYRRRNIERQRKPRCSFVRLGLLPVMSGEPRSIPESPTPDLADMDEVLDDFCGDVLFGRESTGTKGKKSRLKSLPIMVSRYRIFHDRHKSSTDRNVLRLST
mmetsp:Transcript_44577/g.66147  ORF Transcript_44577/g.66147 Transcript_44577/m.66147 type:complete len:118 (+) Transcript_44577:435-788(+)